MAAIGVITLFNGYRAGALDSVEPEQAEIISSELKLGLNTVVQTNSSSGGSFYYEEELPDRVAGNEYVLSLEDDSIVLDVGSSTYTTPLSGFTGYDLSGSVRGGEVTIFKRGNNIRLRPS